MFQLSPRVATCLAFVVGGILLLANVVLASLSKTLDDEDAVEEERDRELQARRRVSQKQFAQRSVEICVSDIEGCIEAVEGGATSLELCSNRLEGGVTPSIGFIQQAVAIFQSTNVAVHVLVRPRQGDFVYSAAEFEVLIRDLLMCQSEGVDGIVTGILTPQGAVDVVRMQIVRDLCPTMLLTFHRAFDVMPSAASASPGRSLEDDYLQAMDIVGCDRLLTSGRAAGCMAGLAELRRLADEEQRLAAMWEKEDAAAVAGSQADGANRRGAKCIVAAAGITPQVVQPLILSTRVQAIHLGSGVCVKQGGSSSVNVGSNNGGDACREAVSRELVEQVVAAAHAAWLLLDQDDAAASARAQAADAAYAHVQRDPTSTSATDIDAWVSCRSPEAEVAEEASEARLSPRDSLESAGLALSADSLDTADGFVLVHGEADAENSEGAGCHEPLWERL